MTRRRLAAALALVAPLLLAVAPACNDVNNHLLEGQEYSVAGGCLAPPTVIDDLPGTDPGDNCSPECISVPQSEGGAAVFITTTCPPYPGYSPPESKSAAQDASDPCMNAFALYFSDAASCTILDGGIIAVPDATADAEGGRADATVEAGLDGGVEAAAETGGPETSVPESGGDGLADALSGE